MVVDGEVVETKAAVSQVVGTGPLSINCVITRVFFVSDPLIVTDL